MYDNILIQGEDWDSENKYYLEQGYPVLREALCKVSIDLTIGRFLLAPQKHAQLQATPIYL